MRIVVEQIEVSYKMFEPGEKVMAASPRSSLDQNKVYVVVKCWRPLIPGEDSAIQIEGDNDRWHSTQYVIPV